MVVSCCWLVTAVLQAISAALSRWATVCHSVTGLQQAVVGRFTVCKNRARNAELALPKKHQRRNLTKMQ